MAGKTKEMSLLKQIIRMRLNGVGFKPRARALDIGKKTVKTYVLKAEAYPNIRGQHQRFIHISN